MRPGGQENRSEEEAHLGELYLEPLALSEAPLHRPQLRLALQQPPRLRLEGGHLRQQPGHARVPRHLEGG